MCSNITTYCLHNLDYIYMYAWVYCTKELFIYSAIFFIYSILKFRFHSIFSYFTRYYSRSFEYTRHVYIFNLYRIHSFVHTEICICLISIHYHTIMCTTIESIHQICTKLLCSFMIFLWLFSLNKTKRLFFKLWIFLSSLCLNSELVLFVCVCVLLRTEPFSFFFLLLFGNQILYCTWKMPGKKFYVNHDNFIYLWRTMYFFSYHDIHKMFWSTIAFVYMCIIQSIICTTTEIIHQICMKLLCS